MIIALKVGGSVFCPTAEPDAAFAGKLAAMLKRLSTAHRFVVVVGGGRLARAMIEDARRNGENNDGKLHMLGIEASRKNAMLLAKALGDAAYDGVPTDENEVKNAFSSGKIVVMGGFRPGQTTDAVALQAALAVGAGLAVIGTDVRGVYTKDPKKHKDAVFISEMSPAELLDMVETGAVRPGAKVVVDPVAARIMVQNPLKAAVLDIRDLGNLERLISGGEFEGTAIG